VATDSSQHIPPVTVAIPARLHSTRLPRKVLLDVAGQTMLQRTHDVAVRADCGTGVILTDAEEVAEAARAFGARVIMTDPELESGTARIASVIGLIEGEVVVNLQGDAPLTDPMILTEAAAQAARSRAPVTMPVYPMRDPADVADPSVVKVVRGHDGRTLYCSRSPVPHVRDSDDPAGVGVTGAHWGHVGLYTYSREFLTSFDQLPPSALERAERLEQLRWLEAGLQIHTFEVEPQGPSVDTLAQLESVRESFAERAPA